MAYETETPDERAATLERLRMLQNLLRNPTFKRVLGWVEGRMSQILDDVGQLGRLTADERAMMHGKLALLREMQLHLAPTLVEHELATRHPSTPEDVPAEGMLDRAMRPDPL